MGKIDFVLPWVDGGDPVWLAEKRRCEAADKGLSVSDLDANADCRYRDNGLLRYWFRSVEKFTPWVNRIFFVTCGQKPDWLDETNPKLRLVNHADYIPAEYLPTFQSHTIELNLFRLKELSEHFVLFNDDVFLLRPMGPKNFFRKGLPVLACDLGMPRWIGYSNTSRFLVNNCGALKRSMNVNRLLWKHWYKVFNPFHLGVVRAVKNLMSMAVNGVYIPGSFGHTAQPHLKSTFEEVWLKQPKILDRTARCKFRHEDGVNHWLMCAWNVVTGKFYPTIERRLGEHVAINSDTVEHVCKMIRSGSQPRLCLNDSGNDPNLDRCMDEVAAAFQALLPDKSSFEK